MKAFLTVCALAGFALVARASVTLLEGYHQKGEPSEDTAFSKIWKEGGLTIYCEAGRLAGELSPKERATYVWFCEQRIEGRIVYCALDKDSQLHVCFPGSVPVNFWAKVKTPQETAEMLLIALTYKASK